jgi:hypothetical protein
VVGAEEIVGVAKVDQRIIEDGGPGENDAGDEPDCHEEHNDPGGLVHGEGGAEFTLIFLDGARG